MDLGLKDRLVCVSGGASGIGKATALALAREGANLAILDVKESAIEATLIEIRAFGTRAEGAVADVRDGGALQAAADRFEDRLGPVYGLVAAAGISSPSPAETLSIEAFQQVIDVNLTGLFRTCQLFGRSMIARKEGAIVIIGSLDGIAGQPGRTHYVASKHGVTGITRNLALEWGRHGIRVNCLAPGFVDTPLLHANVPQAFIGDIADRTPLGRLARADEIANVALMLLSAAASYVTGTVLPIDGGLSAGFFTRRQGEDYASNALLEAGIYQE